MPTDDRSGADDRALLRRLALREAPYAFAAVVVAELFFKLGSFSLELAACAATWAALSWLGRRLQRAGAAAAAPAERPGGGSGEHRKG
jgi:hypothetical protein